MVNDLSFFKGVTVTRVRHEIAGYDGFGKQAFSIMEEEIENVIIALTASSVTPKAISLEASTQLKLILPEGTEVLPDDTWVLPGDPSLEWKTSAEGFMQGGVEIKSRFVPQNTVITITRKQKES